MCRAFHEIMRDVGFNFQQLPVPAKTDSELQKVMTRCWCKERASVMGILLCSLTHDHNVFYQIILDHRTSSDLT